MSRKKTEVDFETALQQLEALVQKMDSETLSLEEALHCFEQGVTLTKQCQKALAEAEQKVMKITQAAIVEDTDNAD